MCIYIYIYIIEGSLEAEIPTIWTDGKAAQLGRSSDVGKVRREKMQVREKVGRSRNAVFFRLFGGFRGSKSRLAKATGAAEAGQIRDEKLRAARSTFASKKCQSTTCSEHFWKLRC